MVRVCPHPRHTAKYSSLQLCCVFTFYYSWPKHFFFSKHVRWVLVDKFMKFHRRGMKNERVMNVYMKVWLIPLPISSIKREISVTPRWYCARRPLYLHLSELNQTLGGRLIISKALRGRASVLPERSESKLRSSLKELAFSKKNLPKRQKSQGVNYGFCLKWPRPHFEFFPLSFLICGKDA